MRTTITLDHDVHNLLKEAARRSGHPFEQVLNDALRVGLQADAKSVAPFRQHVFSMGNSLVDLTKACLLASDLEDRRG